MFLSNTSQCPEIRRMLESSVQERDGIPIDPVKSDVYSLGLCALEL